MFGDEVIGGLQLGNATKDESIDGERDEDRGRRAMKQTEEIVKCRIHSLGMWVLSV